MKRSRKCLKYGMLSVGMVFLAVSFGACGAKKETLTENVVISQSAITNSSPLTMEQVSKVTYGDVTKRDLYESVVTPYVEELFFVQEGTFLEYCVGLGEEVKEGQTLALTDTTQLESTIEQLQETVDSMKEQYAYEITSLQNRIAILQEELAINYEALENMEYMAAGYTATCQAIGRQTKSVAELELEIKHATQVYELELPYYQEKLKETKQMLNSNVIKAPFDGVVVQLRAVAGGEGISTQEPYMAVADVNRYLVQGTYIGSSNINRVERIYVFINGEEYEVEYIPMDGELYGEIQAKGKTAYSSYEILTQEPLAFGQSAVIVVVQESKDNVLIVPQTGVKQEATSYFCYVKRGEEKEKVYIEVGLYDGMNYEVLGGLAEGDEVVIE